VTTVTLLWIHGLGESGRCFDAIAAHPALAGARSLAPDLPGYGDAERPSPPAGLAGHADHLAAWLGDRGAPPVVVVGHSMGGVVGTLLAERHPARVRRLIDVDGNVSPGDCTYSRLGLAEAIALVDERATTDLAHRGYAARLRLADPAAYARDARELIAWSAAEDAAARLARLAVPAVYVAGAPGGACPRSRALLDAAGVPTIAIAPSGHWPFVDQPDRFAAAVAEVAS
jgi:pimeloyl-ACP methyl ester carboxylesterase